MVKKRHESYLFLKEMLGFSPEDYSLYRLALRHGSASLRGVEGSLINNERLEFLGDAVINLIVSDTLYQHSQNEDEGFLTISRSKIVKRETLDLVARSIQLDKLLIVEKNVGSNKDTHILGSAFEALVGAIYIDMGFEMAKTFVVEKLINMYAEFESVLTEKINYKSILLEWSQRNQYSLEFELLEVNVTPNNKHLFVSQVIIDNIAYAIGKGRSKKESHQEAARLTLLLLDQDV